MADTKISALTAASAAGSADLIPVVQSGATKGMTVAQLAAYPGNGGLYGWSGAVQGAGFASDTLLTGSVISVPSGLQAGTVYRLLFYVTKTAAGTAAPIVTIRFGTSGTTADSTACALTFGVQTGAADTAVFELTAEFLSVGSGTSAVVKTIGKISHSLASTGFSTTNNGLAVATGSGFNSTTAGSKISASVNGGTSASWTVQMVLSELRNVT